jgi:hypothetical protein
VSARSGTAETVVVAALEDPVMVSDTVKIPLGTVIVMEVEPGFVITSAVTALVPPVMVSPTLKEVEDATDKVIVPTG